MDMTAPERILVRAPNWVGDVVMTTPGLRALRYGFPDAQIVVQIRPGLEGLLSSSPHIDEVIHVESYHRGFAAMVKEGARLRSLGSFDLGICIPESFSSAFLQRAGGVKQVVGYGGGLRAPLVHEAIAVPEAWGARRMVARERFVLGLMEAVGCKQLGTQLELATSPTEEIRVDEVLQEQGIDVVVPLVVMAPGASFGSSKCWPPEFFAEVGDALHALGARVVLLGSEVEASLTAKVAGAMQTKPVDLGGLLALGDAKALIKRASLLICNDAGTRHIAVAFDVPSIVFFGPTSLEKTNLNLESVEALETDDACRPCYKRTCPIDHRCMTGIPPSRVVELARATLDRSS